MSTKVDGFDAALSLINAWITNMERAPRMWGDDESLELQMLQLVEIRQLMLRPLALGLDHRETRRGFCRFISLINGSSYNSTLSSLLRDEGRLSELPRLLGDFARYMALEYPPELAT